MIPLIGIFLFFSLIVILIQGDYRSSIILQVNEEDFLDQAPDAYQRSYFIYYTNSSIYGFPDDYTYQKVKEDLNTSILILPPRLVKDLLGDRLFGFGSRNQTTTITTTSPVSTTTTTSITTSITTQQAHDDDNDDKDGIIVDAILPSIRPEGTHWTQLLAARIEYATTLERNTFAPWDHHVFLWRKVNPSILLFQGRMLICWKDHSKRLGFGWLSKDLTTLYDDEVYLGLGGTSLTTRFPLLNHFNESQEDGRLLRIDDHTFLLTFISTQKVGPNKERASMFYTFGRLVNDSLVGEDQQQPPQQRIHFTEVVRFDSELDTQQRNWLPFALDRSIYLLHTIGPIQKILKILGHTKDQIAVVDDISNEKSSLGFLSDEGGYAPEVSSSNNNNNHNNNHNKRKKRKTTPRGRRKSREIPWKKEFGESLHGGSPLLRINEDLFLFFFHSTDFSHFPCAFYMGAATLCAHSLRIHSVSTFPIVVKALYKGKPFSRRVSYIVFPIGLERHPFKKDVVLVSFGWQDTHGIVLEMRLSALLNSLSLVNRCRRHSEIENKVEGKEVDQEENRENIQAISLAKKLGRLKGGGGRGRFDHHEEEMEDDDIHQH